jgi:hypothetical protein
VSRARSRSRDAASAIATAPSDHARSWQTGSGYGVAAGPTGGGIRPTADRALQGVVLALPPRTTFSEPPKAATPTQRQLPSDARAAALHASAAGITLTTLGPVDVASARTNASRGSTTPSSSASAEAYVPDVSRMIRAARSARSRFPAAVALGGFGRVAMAPTTTMAPTPSSPTAINQNPRLDAGRDGGSAAAAPRAASLAAGGTPSSMIEEHNPGGSPLPATILA